MVAATGKNLIKMNSTAQTLSDPRDLAFQNLKDTLVRALNMKVTDGCKASSMFPETLQTYICSRFIQIGIERKENVMYCI